VPEGDTLHRTAAALAASLTGEVVTAVTGSHRAVQRDAARITGRRILDVTATGKHLVIRFDNGWAMRTHLGMSGSWHTYRPGAPWRRSRGAARVVLEAGPVVAVCFAAPTVQIGPDEAVSAAMAHLGPDLAGAGVDWDAIAAAIAATDPERTVADLLLDQRLAAGIGNVYKSETLFVEGVLPTRSAGDLGPDTALALFRRGRRLLRANLSTVDRATTGDRSRNGRLWVYDRGGLPCRRCASGVIEGYVGTPARITYWCPRCQR
jgi:endonuclease VIII